MPTDDQHAGWILIKHPDGWSYRYHAQHRIVYDGVKNPPNQLPTTHLEPPEGDDEYFLSDSNRKTLWVVDTVCHNKCTKTNNFGPTTQYWEYISKHPGHSCKPLDSSDEARRYLQWCRAKTCFSGSKDYQIPGFSPTQCECLLDMLEKLKFNTSRTLDGPGNPPVGRENANTQPCCRANTQTCGHANAQPCCYANAQPRCHVLDHDTSLLILLIAHILEKKYSIEHEFYKITNADGKPSVIGRDAFQKRIKEKKDQASSNHDILNICFSVAATVLFFRIPQRYMRHISRIRSNIITNAQWRFHLDQLKNEWSNSNLVAGILVSGSVSLLALGVHNSSVPRVATVISVLFGLGSVLSGLYWTIIYQSHLLSQDGEDEDEMQNYFGHFVEDHDVRLRAIILALPVTMLLWSLISLAVAVLGFNFLGTDNALLKGVSYAAATVLGVVALFLLIGWLSLRRVWDTKVGSLIC